MKGETHWITGLKGIFALVVLLRHYANGFFPALHTGNSADAGLLLGSGAASIEEIMNHTPLYFFVNGGFAVYIFWTLSAFLLSYYYYTHEVTCIDMRKKALKRYLSVLFPIAVTYVLVYAMLKVGLFYNTLAGPYAKSDWLAGFYTFTPTVSHLLRSLFIDTFFTANVPYNPVLWTIEIEVKGSFLLALFLYLFGSMKNRNKLVLVLLAVVLYTARLQYLCFILGMVLADWGEQEKWKIDHFNRPYIYGIFIISLFLAGYPSDFAPTGVYGLFPVTISFINQVWDTRTLIYVTAATGIIFSVSLEEGLKKFFSQKIFVFMGSVSTEVYMLHLIVECSLSSALFVKLSTKTGSYAFSSLAMLAASIVIVYCAAIPFHRLNKWYGKKLEKWLTKTVV